MPYSKISHPSGEEPANSEEPVADLKPATGAEDRTRTCTPLREEDFLSRRAADQCLFDSLPFFVYESYEECSTVRGLWTPPWTPVPIRSSGSAVSSVRSSGSSGLDEGMSCIDVLNQLISPPCDSPTSNPSTSAGFGTPEGKGQPRAARDHARFRRGCRSRMCLDRRGSP